MGHKGKLHEIINSEMDQVRDIQFINGDWGGEFSTLH